MPIDIDDFLKEGDSLPPKPVRMSVNGQHKNGKNGFRVQSSDAETDNAWLDLFRHHPPGGGAFNGRNNALTKLVGFLRAKDFPLEAALEFAQDWNRRHCDPPLDDSEVHNLVERGWVEWLAGGTPDKTPEDAKSSPKAPERPAWKLLTTAELLDYTEAEGGVSWLLENVFVYGGLHYISAPSDSSKSMIMLDLARCFTHDVPWFGRYPLPQVPVLYLDEEMGPGTTSGRARKLGVEPGKPLLYIGNEGITLSRDADLDEVVLLVKQHGIKVLFLDALTRFHTYNEDSATEMRALFARFKEIMAEGCAIIAAHHDNKGGDDSNVAHRKMRGSTEIPAMADMTYAIERVSNGFRLTTSKGRLVAEADRLTVDYAVEDSPDKSRIFVRELTSEERVEKAKATLAQTLRLRILDILMEGGLVTTELCAKVKGAPAEVTTAVKALVEEGMVIATRTGGKGGGILYSLAQNTPI